MKVAVYSGSFNPLHIGHLAILRYLVTEAAFDAVYLIVSPVNPFKEGVSQKSAEERLADARCAVARYPELSMVKVDDIELTMPAPHYTVRTLSELREREPQNTFTLVVGGDNIEAFRRWRDYGTILRDFGVVVYPRPDYDHQAAIDSLLAEDSSYRIGFIDAPQTDISSSRIRAMQADGESVAGLVM